MASAISSQKLFQRQNLHKAQDIVDGTTLIAALVHQAVKVAKIVKDHAKDVPGAMSLPIPAKDIPFKITKDLLIHLFEPTTSELRKLRPSLSKETTDKVERFFSEYFEFNQVPDEVFTIKGNPKDSLDSIQNHLKIKYRQHKDWFKKIDLPIQNQRLSCFDYVFLRLNIFNSVRLYSANLRNRLLLYRQLSGVTVLSNQIYVDFLKFENYKPSSLPLQKDDILVYFNNSEPTHAALVAEDTRKVYAKFGNKVPFAYEHDLDETPTFYGIEYQVFRKQR